MLKETINVILEEHKVTSVPRVCFLLCLRKVEKNSDLGLGIASSGLNIIRNFSMEYNLQKLYLRDLHSTIQRLYKSNQNKGIIYHNFRTHFTESIRRFDHNYSD